MAYVLKCDRCGKIVESLTYKHDPLRDDSLGVKFASTSTPKYYDLCEICELEVLDFFAEFDCNRQKKGGDNNA